MNMKHTARPLYAILIAIAFMAAPAHAESPYTANVPVTMVPHKPLSQMNENELKAFWDRLPRADKQRIINRRRVELREEVRDRQFYINGAKTRAIQDASAGPVGRNIKPVDPASRKQVRSLGSMLN